MATRHPSGILLLLALSGAVLHSPARALSVFDLSGPSVNQSIKSFLDNGVTLTIANANSIGQFNANTINTNPRGLCAWTKVGTTGFGRCGYGAADPQGGISAFTLEFDKHVRLLSFAVSSFQAIAITTGTINFSLDNLSFLTKTFSATGNQTLSLEALAFQPIFVTTSATYTAANTFDTGLFRINNLTVQEVPAPVTPLAVALAFNSTRRLRRLSRRLRSLQAIAPAPLRFPSHGVHGGDGSPIGWAPDSTPF